MNLREDYYSFLYSHIEYENILQDLKGRLFEDLSNIELVILSENYGY